MSDNPFEVTKAVDFTDAQIASTWVDLPGGGFVSLTDPRSPMPLFLVGGKGGGRTHLLRYYSFALQRLRHQHDLLAGIRNEGYLGIYFRCGGLNSSRFSGKRQSEETWASVFSYYTEVWLGGLTVDLIGELNSAAPENITQDQVKGFITSVLQLFDVDVANDRSVRSAADLGDVFKALQRDLDVAINNAALKHELDIRIAASPGRLVFGIPRVAAQHFPSMDGLAFAYLIDEFENLTEDQQRYVNTLIREKQLPTTFLIGSRRFGVRTHKTLSAGEENKQGSEFDQVVLEDAYRSKTQQYKAFCTDIVLRRLQQAGTETGAGHRIDDFFENPNDLAPTLEDRAVVHMAKKSGDDRDRPWIARLEQMLLTSGHEAIVDTALRLLRVPESPLHEKFAVFLFYRAWADGGDLLGAADSITKDVRSLMEDKSGRGKINTTYKHYRHDLYAQLLNELRLPQEYSGLEDFVRMSGFLPRNLLVVLKQITRWSLFLGERPFQGDKISLRAQQEGIREASAWFLSDAKGLGRIGEETQFAIRRLASLFREMRFADKPVEVSCSTFSTDRMGLSSGATDALNEALSHSLILEIPRGRRDRNTHVLHHKYQLNPMLAPQFDLSLARRGAVRLTAEELNTIFDPSVNEARFDAMKSRMLGRLNAPYSQVRPANQMLRLE